MRIALLMFAAVVVACGGETTPPPIQSATPTVQPQEPTAPAESAPEPAIAAEPLPAPEGEEPSSEMAAPPATPSPPAGRDYVACGCGCCGGGPPANAEVRCVESEAALQEIIDADRRAHENPGCAVRGCAIGRRFRVCD